MIIHWCFNCNGYTEVNFHGDHMFCIVCAKLTGVKSNDPPGHPDDWDPDQEEDKT